MAKHEKHSTGGGKRRVKRWQKIVIAIVIILLALLGIGYGIVISKLGKIEKDTEIDLSKLKTVEIEGYRNIVLLGIDSRDMATTTGTRSDAIMIASINESTKEVKVTSVYRDTLLKMGDTETYEKITHAHAYGGPQMALESLDQALDLDATEYVLFNFKAVADAVDAVGGITVEVSEGEINELNRITNDTAKHLGRDQYSLVEVPGEQTLEGVQAVAYGRMRKGVGDDYKRTERMREVVSLLLKKVRGMSVTEINDLMSIVLPQIKTNLTNNQILSLALSAGKYSISDSIGFPYDCDGGMVNGMSVIIPIDLEKNVTKWHQEIFEEESYAPSDSVKEISDHVKEMTGIY